MTHRIPSTRNGVQRPPQARVVGAQEQTARRETRDQGDQGTLRLNLASDPAALREAPRQPSVALLTGERLQSSARLDPLFEAPNADEHDLPVRQSLGQFASSDALIPRVGSGGGRPAFPEAPAYGAHALAQPPGAGETHVSSPRRVGSGFLPIGRFLTTARESACFLPEAGQPHDPMRDPVAHAATPATPATPAAQRSARSSLSSPHEADPGSRLQDRSGFAGPTGADGTTCGERGERAERADHSGKHAPAVRQTDSAVPPPPQPAQVDVTASGPAAASPRAPFRRVGSLPQVRGARTRDHAGEESPAVAQRVAAARWVCPHCGVVEPHTLTILDLVLVRPGQCACQTEERQRRLAQLAAAERASARDAERRTRYFGGLRPEDVAWRQRFETFEGGAGGAERQASEARAPVADETPGVYSRAQPVASPRGSDVPQQDTGYGPSERASRSAERARDVSLGRRRWLPTTGFTASPGVATAAVIAVGTTRHPDPDDAARERARAVASLETPTPGSIGTAVAAVEDWVALLALVWDQARVRARVESQDATGTIIAPMYASLTQTYALTALTRLPRLILLGPTGVGKTHLLVAAYHALIDHDIPVRYVPARSFLDALRHSWDTARQRTAGGGGGRSGVSGFGGDDGGLEEEVMRQLISTPVLLLDGLSGSQGSSGWAASRWARLFEERAQRGRPWAVAARSIDALAQAAGGDATLETICERACPVELQAPSHRARALLTPAQLHALRRSFDDGMVPLSPLAAQTVDCTASSTADGR